MGPFTFSTKLSIAVLVVLSVVAAAFGQASPAKAAPAQAPAPAQAAPGTPDYLQEALVFESNHARLTYQDDGSDVREVATVIKVVSQAGVQGMAVLKFPYTSADETVEFDYVRVRKPDGTVVVTPDYNIQDMPAEVTRDAPMYSDVHEKHVTVKALGVGDTLEYLVRYRTVKPQVPGQFWFSYNFTKDYITKDEQLVIDVPRDKYVKVVSPDLAPQMKDEGTRRIYSWKTANVQRKPAAEITLAKLQKTEAPKPSVQITTFHNWEEVGKWYGELARSQVIVTPQLQAKAAELTKGLTSDEDKIRALYDFVSTHYHYVSLSFGIGRYQPHPAEDVFENEYGDCKDKHTLLAALLKAAGYDAWPALINATGKIDPDVPSPGQFNHVITVVPRGNGNLLWLDTTPEVSPFGLLVANIRDKQALVMPTGKPAVLMTTPANPPFLNAVSFNADAQLGADGALKAQIRETMRGDTEVAYRYAFRNTSTAQWNELMQRISYNVGFSGDVTNATATAPDDTKKPFELSYDYSRKDYGDWDDHRIPVFSPVFGIEGYAILNEKPEEPIKFGSAGDYAYTSKIQLPAGYTATVADNVDLVEDFATYHASYTFKDGTLTETRHLTLTKSEIPISEWEAFRRFSKGVSDDGSRMIALNTGSGGHTKTLVGDNPEADRAFQEGYDALQKRDITRAEESFNRVLQLEPKYPGAHANLGVAYLNAGGMDAGIRELRKEEELHPDEVFAYQTLARVLVLKHDIGGAIEQLQKVLQIDPKNRDAAISLGQLLTQEKKYSEAVAVLQKALELAPESGNVKYSLGYAYIRNGDKEKGLALLQKALAADQDTDHGALALNNVAYSLIEMDTGFDVASQYADKALEMLETESLKAGTGRARLINTESLAATWDTVGWIYFKLGQYDKALAYVRSSWLLAQHAEVGDHLGQIYAKLGKKQEAAQAYRLAYAAVGQDAAAGPQLPMLGIIREHYKDLMGKDADPGQFETRRRSNGTYTPMPSEELSRMREVKLTTTSHPAASGTFSIVFSPGKIDQVKLVEGDESAKSMIDSIKAAKFNVEFPDATPTQLVRRGVMSCGSYGCSLTLISPDDRSLFSGE